MLTIPPLQRGGGNARDLLPHANVWEIFGLSISFGSFPVWCAAATRFPEAAVETVLAEAGFLCAGWGG